MSISLVAIVAAATLAATGPTEESLRAADAIQKEAGAKSDAVATEAIQHPNYLGNAPNNRVIDAAKVRELMRSGSIASTGFERDIERVAITGDVGVVMGSETVTPTADSISGKDFSARPLTRRFTNVYLWGDGRWKLLARHANVVAPKVN